MIYTAAVTPYYVAFMDIDPSGAVYWINKFVDVCFFKDLCMNFMLAYQNEAYVLIKDPKTIFMNYLQGWFPIDLLSIIPYDLLAQTSSIFTSLDSLRLVRLVRLLKLARVLRSGRLIKRWETSITMKFSHLTIVNFIVLLVVTAHWLACLWFIVIDIENSQQNWLYCYDHVEHRASCDAPSAVLNGTIINGSMVVVPTPAPTNVESVYESGNPLHRYIVALYWATMTLLTIGYGDVRPRTDAERCVALVAMLIGASIYAYVVGGACQVISKMDWHSNVFYARLDDVNEYMHENGVPDDLQLKVRQYFHFARQTDKDSAMRARLNELSHDMQGIVYTYVMEAILEKVPYMQGLTGTCVTDLTMVMVEAAYPASERIWNAGDASENLLLVRSGILVTRLASDNFVFVTKGHVTGNEVLMFPDHLRHAACACATPVTCLTLRRKELWEIMDKHEDLRFQIQREAFKIAVCLYAAAQKRARNGEESRHRCPRAPCCNFEAGDPDAAIGGRGGMTRNESVASLLDEEAGSPGPVVTALASVGPIGAALGAMRRDMRQKLGKLHAEQAQVQTDLRTMRSKLEAAGRKAHTRSLIARP